MVMQTLRLIVMNVMLQILILQQTRTTQRLLYRQIVKHATQLFRVGSLPVFPYTIIFIFFRERMQPLQANVLTAITETILQLQTHVWVAIRMIIIQLLRRRIAVPDLVQIAKHAIARMHGSLQILITMENTFRFTQANMQVSGMPAVIVIPILQIILCSPALIVTNIIK